MGCKLLTKTAVTHYSRALTLDFYTTAPMLIYADPPSPTTRAVRRPADPPPMVASPPISPRDSGATPDPKPGRGKGADRLTPGSIGRLGVKAQSSTEQCSREQCSRRGDSSVRSGRGCDSNDEDSTEGSDRSASAAGQHLDWHWSGGDLSKPSSARGDTLLRCSKFFLCPGCGKFEPYHLALQPQWRERLQTPLPTPLLNTG